MLENRKQSENNTKQIKKVKLIFVLGLFVIVSFFGYSSFVFGKRVLLASTQKNELYTKLANLRDRKANVQAEIGKLQTQDGKEDILKNDLGSYKNDEHVIIFVDSKNKEK